MLYLKEANMEDAAKEYAFVSELPQCENGFTNECPGVSEEEFTSRVLPRMIAFARGEGLPAGYVPETSLFLWEDGRTAKSSASSACATRSPNGCARARAT